MATTGYNKRKETISKKGRKVSVQSKLRRNRDFLYFMVSATKCSCSYCGERIDPNLIISGSAKDDQVLLHHIDENRTNDDPSNLSLVHRCCHQKLHDDLEKGLKVKLKSNFNI